MRASTSQQGYQPYVSGASSEQVSAPMLVVVAYSTIWLVLLLFVLSIWWRQRKVNDELAQLKQKAGG